MVSVTAAAAPATHSVTLRISGGTAGALYTVWRRQAGLPDVPIEAPRAYTASTTVVDECAPFAHPLTYRVANVANATDHADSAPVTLPYGGNPVLRSALGTAWVAAPLMEASNVWDQPSTRIVVPGSRNPTVSSSTRQRRSGTITIRTTSEEQRASVMAMVDTPGNVLHLRAPCAAGFEDVFLTAWGLAEVFVDQDRPQVRHWSLDYQEVDRPLDYALAPLVPLRGWDALKAQYASWDALRATGASWDEIYLGGP